MEIQLQFLEEILFLNNHYDIFCNVYEEMCIILEQNHIMYIYNSIKLICLVGHDMHFDASLDVKNIQIFSYILFRLFQIWNIMINHIWIYNMMPLVTHRFHAFTYDSSNIYDYNTHKYHKISTLPILNDQLSDGYYNLKFVRIFCCR